MKSGSPILGFMRMSKTRGPPPLFPSSHGLGNPCSEVKPRFPLGREISLVLTATQAPSKYLLLQERPNDQKIPVNAGFFSRESQLRRLSSPLLTIGLSVTEAGGEGVKELRSLLVDRCGLFSSRQTAFMARTL